MNKIFLRVVGEGGSLGAVIGSASAEGANVTYDGAPMLKDKIDAIVQRFRIDEATALERLAADGWSNGNLAITAEES